MAKTEEDTSSPPQSYTLCLNGLQAWNAKRAPTEKDKTLSVPVVSREVAKQLREMLSPWWETLALVNEDLLRDSKRVLMRREVVRSIASYPLVSELLKWPEPVRCARAPGKRKSKREDRESFDEDDKEDEEKVSDVKAAPTKQNTATKKPHANNRSASPLESGQALHQVHSYGKMWFLSASQARARGG